MRRQLRRFLNEILQALNRAFASLGEKDINAFLSQLAVDGKGSYSIQNQALASLLFFFKQILETPVGELGEVIRAKKPIRLPRLSRPATPNALSLAPSARRVHLVRPFKANS